MHSPLVFVKAFAFQMSCHSLTHLPTRQALKELTVEVDFTPVLFFSLPFFCILKILLYPATYIKIKIRLSVRVLVSYRLHRRQNQADNSELLNYFFKLNVSAIHSDWCHHVSWHVQMIKC